MLEINSQKETTRIVMFLKKTFRQHKIKNAVIGLSGGIDSTTSLYLLKKTLPTANIFVAHLSYFANTKNDHDVDTIIKDAKIPKSNIFNNSIRPSVDAMKKNFGVTSKDTTRLGNIMARVRMIALYDLAKKHNALVVGTENKSEHHLGYFTRFGDEASDIEPIRHLYKTQVYQLATHLVVPKEIIDKAPTAGLWQGQTDEKEFGFSYQEADKVLYYYVEKKLSVEAIREKGFGNAETIIKRVTQNNFKHQVPYVLNPLP